MKLSAKEKRDFLIAMIASFSAIIAWDIAKIGFRKFNKKN